MSRTQPIRILAVDDDESALVVVESLLEDAGYRVSLARDGREALDRVRDERPQLVITDILMPSMDGYQLCRQIKSDPELRPTPLIFYSATYTDDDDRELALGLGAARFVIKPADPATLKQSVAEVLEESRSQPTGCAPETEADEATYLRKYNRRLIAKLEDKISQLDASNRELQMQIARAQTAESRIRELAFRDPLTGLANRNRMLQHLEETFGSMPKTCAVLVADLDGFHEINHALGHRKGDLLLRRVAERFAELPRDPGDLLVHLGGDEFALLLLDVGSRTQGETAARRLVESLEPAIDLEGLPVGVTASVGISLFPDHGKDGSLLLRNAEVAMRGAKGSRGSISFYAPDRDPYDPERLEMISGIRRAIRESELLLHFQPMIDMASGSVVAVEALTRWNHPDHGLLGPDTFIGHVERTGQISDLTRWLLRSSLEQYRDWQRRGLDLRLSLNLSARSLVEDLPADLARVLEELELGRPRLTFEITESVILGDPRITRSVLEKLADLGVEIAIDDFGTGYSSLSLLRRLPLRELKIDRSFVTEMEQNESDAAIVRSTIELASHLGLRVTAEGVETEAVWRLLRDAGCDLAQGFFMARPMPGDELESWIATSRWGSSGRS